MKALFRFFFLLGLLFSLQTLVTPTKAKAQGGYVRQLRGVVKDSTKNTDTSYFDVEFTLKSTAAQIDITKKSGTLAGYAILQGLDLVGGITGSGTWTNLDTLTIANQANNNKHIQRPATLIYSRYRWRVTESGTGQMKPIKVYVLDYD